MPFSSYQGHMLSTSLVTLGVDRDHLAEVVFVRFLHWKIILSMLYSWEGQCEAHLREELCSNSLRVVYLHKSFEIFLHGRFAYSMHLFIYLFIHPFIDSHMYVYQYRLIYIYFIFWL